MTPETLMKLRNRQPLRLFDKSEKLFHTIQLNRSTSFICWQRFVSRDRKNWTKHNETLTLKDVNQIIEQIKSNRTK